MSQPVLRVVPHTERPRHAATVANARLQALDQLARNAQGKDYVSTGDIVPKMAGLTLILWLTACSTAFLVGFYAGEGIAQRVFG